MKARTLFYFLPFIGALSFILLGGPQWLYSNKPETKVSGESETFFAKARNALNKTDILPPLGSLSADTGLKGSSNLYRWQDKNGQWHFSNIPPAKGDESGRYTSAQVSRLPEVINSIPPPEMRTSSTTKPSSGTRFPSPTTVNPMDIPKLLEQAKGVQSLMNQRPQQIDNALK